MNYNIFHELKIKHVMRFLLRLFGTLLKNPARLIKNLYNQKHILVYVLSSWIDLYLFT